ncbi:phenylacetate--CoA ligase family protein [Marinilabilia sp.]|uniref:phenylacetate--CoA ligase family protein n=1 Tax=Marinilabilia sp. TaxID=2021252 RepID=UPI0025C24669|nr:phenylacetate--CoA ligase [Marinilabilia sp.]
MNWDLQECCTREEMASIQLKRLQSTIARVYEKVPYYREKMEAQGVKPKDIMSLSDLRKLPFTEKTDLRDTYPFGLFAASQEEIIRLHASSGTTGKPIVVGYTENDIEIWREMIVRTMYAADISAKDTIQIAYGYGLFTGGMGIHYGAEKVKARVIPISGGNTRKQIELMEDFGTTVLACTPSYALHLGEEIKRHPGLRSRLQLKTAILGAEPWTEQMRHQIENLLEIDAYDIYGLSEIIGPGVAYECENKNGLHINEDHFIPEIIDPETLDPLGAGEYGELVFTTITKEGIPIIRYRTRDLTALNYEPCECGRSLVRMSKCEGRSDDMLIIRGVNLFPSQIEAALLDLNLTSSHYELHVSREGTLDKIRAVVEMKEETAGGTELLQRKIRSHIEHCIGLSLDLELAAPNQLERFTGKSKRVFDNRRN